MEILREKKFYSFSARDADEHIGVAILENDTWLLIREDGTAIDKTGRKYVRVSEEIRTQVPKRTNPKSPVWLDYWDGRESIAGMIEDADLRELGWTTDADEPVILPQQS